MSDYMREKYPNHPSMRVSGVLLDCSAEATRRFLRRCESALRVAREVGKADWMIEGLEEAVADAKHELALALADAQRGE